MMRQQCLEKWLTAVFPNTPIELELASADASFRQYWRCHLAREDKTFIVMDAPPDKEDSHDFVRIAKWLYQHHIRVPEIIAENIQEGFLVLTDLGTQHYLSVLSTENADKLYKQAMAALIAMQRCYKKDPLPLAKYDQTRLLNELHLFPQWYLNCHLGYVLNKTEQLALQQCFDFLINNILQQTTGFVHRDYHSRNLMYGIKGQLGIIDFQDAVEGAYSYDLVSLLRDCYIVWPEEQVTQWALYYQQCLYDAGLMSQLSEQQFLRDFDLMGLQRHLKVLGIFARLYHRDGKVGYLKDLPTTWEYALKVSKCYPELDFLQQLLLSAQAK